MPRLPEPETPTSLAVRNLVASHGNPFCRGTMEEFVEQKAYDEEILGDQEYRRPHVPIPNISRNDFLVRLPERQKTLGIPPAGKRMPSAFIRGVKHGSTTPIARLEPVRLQDMKIRERHEGKYLLCRIITSPVRQVSVSFGVEDENGWVHHVTLHNFPFSLGTKVRELETIFPLNTVLVIREPYVKMSCNGQDCHTRIDTPSDLIFLEADDPLLAGASWKTGDRPLPSTVRTADQWKAAGNKHFRDGDYFAAVVAYTFVLRQDPALATLRLNRALAYLRLEHYHSALSECEEVLDLAGIDQDSKVKALYRAGQATYGLAGYVAAQDWYGRCLSEDPESNDAQSGIDRCRRRISERDTGDYDWVALLKNGERRPSRQDVANYQGPVEVVPMVGRGGGRGVVASRDIERGELLVVSKAFVADYRADHRQADLIATHDFTTKKWAIGMYYSAIQRLMSKTYASPALTSQLFDLYAGPQIPIPAPFNPEDLIQTHHNNPLAFPMDIDINRIENILILNNLLTEGQDDRNISDTGAPLALFKLPSYFNHSCIPNANRMCYGDVIVIRAIENIPKGKEITLAYYFSARYQRRQEMLAKHVMRCDCELCKQDRAAVPAQLSRRDKLVEEAESRDMTIAQASAFVEAVKKTYPANAGPRIRPALAYANYRQQLAALQISNVNQAECKLFEKASFQNGLDLMNWSGLTTLDKLTEHDLPADIPWKPSDMPFAITKQKILEPAALSTICISQAASCVKLDMPRKAKKWLYGAIWLENIALGGGIKLFKACHEAEMKVVTPLWSIINEIERSLEIGET